MKTPRCPICRLGMSHVIECGEEYLVCKECGHAEPISATKRPKPDYKKLFDQIRDEIEHPS